MPFLSPMEELIPEEAREQELQDGRVADRPLISLHSINRISPSKIGI